MALLVAIPVAARAFAQGYVTHDMALRPGMSVALSDESTAETPQVERATQENPQKIVGIATDVGQNLATSASGAHKVYVQSSGTVKVFASNLNGDIKQGDTLTISPLKGILMKADGSAASIGVALEDFPSHSAETQTINTSKGEQNVLVTKLAASIAFSVPPGQTSSEANNSSSLERIGSSLAGKDVNETRVIAALIIFLIMMTAEGAIIYAAVSSAIISMGRNPYSKGIIRGELTKVLGIVIVVLFIGSVSIYAILSI